MQVPLAAVGKSLKAEQRSDKEEPGRGAVALQTPRRIPAPEGGGRTFASAAAAGNNNYLEAKFATAET